MGLIVWDAGMSRCRPPEKSPGWLFPGQPGLADSPFDFSPLASRPGSRAGRQRPAYS
jgi:hypothetical protein